MTLARRCGALRNIAFESPDNQRKIAAAGGIEVVITAMREHPRQPSVQQRGALAASIHPSTCARRV